MKILDSLNLRYKFDKVFTDLTEYCGKKLRFDFKVFVKNGDPLFIEYDGRQHFEPINYFGGKTQHRLTKKI